MAMDAPPPAEAVTEVPVIQSRNGAPVDVRYSDFLKLVNADRLEKVTFNADGTKLLGVDSDGVRLKIEALPNDPDLLTQLTTHKVRGLVDKRTLLPTNFLFTLFNLLLRFSNFTSFNFTTRWKLRFYQLKKLVD